MQNIANYVIALHSLKRGKYFLTKTSKFYLFSWKTFKKIVYKKIEYLFS